MKIQLALCTLAAVLTSSLSVSAFAADPSVQLTSFVMLFPRGPVAELCGVVTGIETGYAVARIAADYNTSRVGYYNVLVAKDGRFCTTLTTYYGTAQASVEILGHTVQSAGMSVSSALTR
jgi:hypothetical protein